MEKLAPVMHKVSKLGVYVPSIILLIVIIMVFFVPHKPRPDVTKVMLALTPTVTPIPKVHVAIDLKGPFKCGFNYNSASVSASIKNKQIAADFVEATQSSHFILKGDCLYRWSTLKINGEKFCGMTTVVNAVDLMSSMGLLDIGSLLSMAPPNAATGTQQTLATNEAGIQQFVDSCVKSEPEKTAFDIPTNIIFLEPTVAPTKTP